MAYKSHEIIGVLKYFYNV